MTQKIALIIGVTSQDGAYLTDLLLKQNYTVYGTYRNSNIPNLWRLEFLGINQHPQLQLVPYNLDCLDNTIHLIEKVKPHEIYNLAAQSFVAESLKDTIAIGHITGLGAAIILEAIRLTNTKIKFYQAGSSEMFGEAEYQPQNENTPFSPRNPYGAAKLYAYWIVNTYRNTYDIFAVNGIAYNHESPLRGINFITRKITDGVSKIALGGINTIEVGNLNSMRDWGYAKEYVNGMYKIMQANSPDNYVLATGKANSVREFICLAFQEVNISIEFKGKDLDEIGINYETGKTLVRVNKSFWRPEEKFILYGDASKAKAKIDWSPQTQLKQLSSIMVKADLERNKKKLK